MNLYVIYKVDVYGHFVCLESVWSSRAKAKLAIEHYALEGRDGSIHNTRFYTIVERELDRTYR